MTDALDRRRGPMPESVSTDLYEPFWCDFVPMLVAGAIVSVNHRAAPLCWSIARAPHRHVGLSKERCRQLKIEIRERIVDRLCDALTHRDSDAYGIPRRPERFDSGEPWFLWLAWRDIVRAAVEEYRRETAE
jgi:hypothetical protein